MNNSHYRRDAARLVAADFRVTCRGLIADLTTYLLAYQKIICKVRCEQSILKSR